MPSNNTVGSGGLEWNDLAQDGNKCRTQSANQHMHTFNFLFIKTYLKFLKTLLHFSVIRPSSRSL